MCIQLLSKNDYTLDTAISSEEKWGYYIDSYVLLTPTEGVLASGFPTFLKRNLPSLIPDEPPQDIITRSGLEVKICINTYKIFFVNSTEDYFRRKNLGVPKTQLKDIRAKRLNKMNAWLKSTQEEEKESNVKEQDEAFQKWLLKGPEDVKAGVLTAAVTVPAQESLDGTERKVYKTIAPDNKDKDVAMEGEEA